MTDNREDRVCLGAIVGVHGIRGEVKVKSFTEYDVDIDQYGPLEDEPASRKFDIKVVGHSKEILRVKIKGVDDRNMAETLVGCGLYVSRDKLPELEEEEFYHTDLIGLDVKVADTDEIIGKVLAIYNFGAGDLLDIKINGEKNSLMLPFTKLYVPEVNISDGYIIIANSSSDFSNGENETHEG